jgi:DNA (cytosine-5)-methyltransferase 1
VLNGLHFGVPQKRERVVIVGFDRPTPFVFPTGSHHSTLRLQDVLQPDSEIDARHWVSEHVQRKLATKVKHVPFRPAIWHENKGGNIGINPFSCALRANGSYNYLLVNGQRRLTPREMLRLQGFPDTFKIVVSESQLRKQAGNSVVVPKIEAVARALVAALGPSSAVRSNGGLSRKVSAPASVCVA